MSHADGDLQSSRNLAIIGSILLLFPVLNIAGMILVLIAMKGFSDYYKDSRIFHNTVLSVIFGIIGLIMIAAYFIIHGSISDTFILISNAATQQSIYIPIVLPLLIAVIFTSLMTQYFKKAFNALSRRSGKYLFRIAGNLLHIGVTIPLTCISIILLLDIILQILPMIDLNITVTNGLTNALPSLLSLCLFASLLLIYLAFTLLIITFSSLKPTPQPNTQTTNTKTKFCPHCGTPIPHTATFCTRCGKQT